MDVYQMAIPNGHNMDIYTKRPEYDNMETYQMMSFLKYGNLV